MVVAAKVLQLLLLKVVQEIVDEVNSLSHHPRQINYIHLVGTMPVELRSMRDESHDLLDRDLPDS